MIDQRKKDQFLAVAIGIGFVLLVAFLGTVVSGLIHFMVQYW
jgi:hypothetical protein